MDDNDGGSTDAGANGRIMPNSNGHPSTIGEVRLEIAALRQAFEDHLVARSEQRAADVRERDNARIGIDKRLDGMNEFREALRDQSGRFVERREFEVAREATNERLGQLRPDLGDRMDTMTVKVAGLVERREFDEVRATLTERTEASRTSTEGRLVLLGSAFADKLEQYRTARDSRSEADLAPLRASIEAQGRPNWGLIIACAAVVFGIVSGGWLVIGLKIDGSMAPITLDLAATKTVGIQTAERVRGMEAAVSLSTQADGTSRVDRSQLNDRIRSLETVIPPASTIAAQQVNVEKQMNTIVERLSTLRTSVNKQEAALVEIETQFCGQDNLRNQTHAFDQRLVAMMWKKLYGEEMPISNAFYAHVGRCGTNSAGG